MPCRWLLKRAKRYHHILCNFSDATMIGEAVNRIKFIGDATAPPLLPHLLATCAPAAMLALTVDHDQGKLVQAIDLKLLCHTGNPYSHTTYIIGSLCTYSMRQMKALPVD